MITNGGPEDEMKGAETGSDMQKRHAKERNTLRKWLGRMFDRSDQRGRGVGPQTATIGGPVDDGRGPPADRKPRMNSPFRLQTVTIGGPVDDEMERAENRMRQRSAVHTIGGPNVSICAAPGNLRAKHSSHRRTT